MSNENTKKPEVKNTDQLIADAVQKALADALPMSAGVMAKTFAETQHGFSQASRAAAETARPTGIRCGKCRQHLPSGLKEDEHPHRLVAVYPQNARKHGKWFQGIFINGVRYLSNSAIHKIHVPADADVEKMIQIWEENEDELQTGRQVDHNSGSVDKPTPATVGWR